MWPMSASPRFIAISVRPRTSTTFWANCAATRMLTDPAQDRRFMAAAIRFSLRNLGRTATNPSVGTLIVDEHGVIVGRGVTAVGGRPHAEPQALAEAGERA